MWGPWALFRNHPQGAGGVIPVAHVSVLTSESVDTLLPQVHTLARTAAVKVAM